MSSWSGTCVLGPNNQFEYFLFLQVSIDVLKNYDLENLKGIKIKL